MKPTREDIGIVAQYSNWTEVGVEQALESHVRPNQTEWQRFLKWAILALGAGFFVAGVLFFFAYNWAELHKFAKMGIIFGLILISTISAVVLKVDTVVKQVLLSVSSILVGVLFGVYGQVYQTGADAYDLFLAWSMMALLWVVAARFYPLWLMYLVLVNTTIVLYLMQVMGDVVQEEEFLILAIFNAVTFVVVSFVIPKLSKGGGVAPSWFTNVVWLAWIVPITIYAFIYIFDWDPYMSWIAFIVTAILYTLGAIYGLIQRNRFYLGTLGFGVVVLIVAKILRATDSDMEGALLSGVVVVVLITLLVVALSRLKEPAKIKKQDE